MEKLSPEQQEVLCLVRQGLNVFISGPGGTGKSYLIKLICELYSHKMVKVCALTGCAAELLGCGARTIHSWSGSGMSRGSTYNIINRVYSKKKNRDAWKKVDILIIDEVSMMSVKYFELLDEIGKTIRNSTQPFGGIQLIFSGDFHQLPPIGDESEPDTCKFCFESERWKTTFPNVVLLTHIFRQSDKTFTKILRQVRKGGITQKTHDILNTRLMKKGNKLSYGTGRKPTIISPIRKEVKSVNDRNMSRLDSELVTYESTIVQGGEYEAPTIVVNGVTKIDQKYIDYEINQLKKRMNGELTLQLKLGAHVMCVANLDMEGKQQIVNGSQGIIEDIIDGYPVVRYTNGVVKHMTNHSWKSEEIPGLCLMQVPLILSWAITIHKAQGITLDCAIIDAGDKIFEYGQTYVALSRVKSLEGLFLGNFNYKKIKTNPKVTEYYKSLQSSISLE